MLISPEVLGRDAREYLINSEEFNARIQAVLSDNLSSDKVSKITMHWSRILDKNIKYCEALLKAFQRGVIGI